MVSPVVEIIYGFAGYSVGKLVTWEESKRNLSVDLQIAASWVYRKHERFAQVSFGVDIASGGPVMEDKSYGGANLHSELNFIASSNKIYRYKDYKF